MLGRARGEPANRRASIGAQLRECFRSTSARRACRRRFRTCWLQTVSHSVRGCDAPRLTCGASGAFLEAKSGRVKFEEIKADVLEMVVKFMEYKLKLVNRCASLSRENLLLLLSPGRRAAQQPLRAGV